MTKEKIKEYYTKKNEIINLGKRIEKEKSEAAVIHDIVKGSSIEFPYTQHSVHVEGVDLKKTDLVRSMEKRLQKAIGDLVYLQQEMEEVILKIPDSRTRLIFERIVYDNKPLKEVAQELDCDVSTVRKLYSKVFEMDS